jgi:uncharacterized protein (DUF1330 family)
MPLPTNPTARWPRPASREVGGRYLVRGGEADLFEGAPEPERMVVIEFPDADTARRWYNSEEYQAALKIRLAASRGRVMLVEGAA